MLRKMLVCWIRGTESLQAVMLTAPVRRRWCLLYRGCLQNRCWNLSDIFGREMKFKWQREAFCVHENALWKSAEGTSGKCQKRWIQLNRFQITLHLLHLISTLIWSCTRKPGIWHVACGLKSALSSQFHVLQSSFVSQVWNMQGEVEAFYHTTSSFGTGLLCKPMFWDAWECLFGLW